MTLWYCVSIYSNLGDLDSIGSKSIQKLRNHGLKAKVQIFPAPEVCRLPASTLRRPRHRTSSCIFQVADVIPLP